MRVAHLYKVLPKGDQSGFIFDSLNEADKHVCSLELLNSFQVSEMTFFIILKSLGITILIIGNMLVPVAVETGVEL